MNDLARRLGIAATLAGALLGGCFAGGSEIGLLDAPPLPALEDDPIAIGEQPPPDAGPSLVGFDRRHWSAVKVAAPARQVENYPTYANLSRAEDPGPAYPTTDTCLGNPRRPADEATIGCWVLAYTAWLTVGWPFEMALGRLPWEIERSPQGSYERLGPRSPASHVWGWVVFEPEDPADDA